VARINLYVPNELKARIDQRTDINWSAEFQRLAEEKTSRDWLIVATEGAVRHVNHNNDSKMTTTVNLLDHTSLFPFKAKPEDIEAERQQPRDATQQRRTGR
jgi:hypothetical protein